MSSVQEIVSVLLDNADIQRQCIKMLSEYKEMPQPFCPPLMTLNGTADGVEAAAKKLKEMYPDTPALTQVARKRSREPDGQVEESAPIPMQAHQVDPLSEASTEIEQQQQAEAPEVMPALTQAAPTIASSSPPAETQAQ